MRDRVDDFAQEADGDVREGGAFGAVVVDEVVELGGEDEAGADEQRADVGGFAGAGEAAVRGAPVRRRRRRSGSAAIEAVGPAGALGDDRRDRRRSIATIVGPAGERLPHGTQDGVQAALELTQAEAGRVERFGIGDGDAAFAGRFGDDGAEEAVEVGGLRIADCGVAAVRRWAVLTADGFGVAARRCTAEAGADSRILNPDP